MKLWYFILISISVITFIYGQNTAPDDCGPVNILLNKNQMTVVWKMVLNVKMAILYICKNFILLFNNIFL